MATRGWTSSAASMDPHVFRAPCTVILGTPARVMRRSKLRLKLRGSIGVPCRVVNTRPVSTKAARQAARGAATARSPSLPLRRRQRRSAGAKKRETFGPPLTDSSYREVSRGVSMLPLRNCPRPVRTRQGRL